MRKESISNLTSKWIALLALVSISTHAAPQADQAQCALELEDAPLILLENHPSILQRRFKWQAVQERRAQAEIIDVEIEGWALLPSNEKTWLNQLVQKAEADTKRLFNTTAGLSPDLGTAKFRVARRNYEKHLKKHLIDLARTTSTTIGYYSEIESYEVEPEVFLRDSPTPFSNNDTQQGYYIVHTAKKVPETNTPASYQVEPITHPTYPNLLGLKFFLSEYGYDMVEAVRFDPLLEELKIVLRTKPRRIARDRLYQKREVREPQEISVWIPKRNSLRIRVEAIWGAPTKVQPNSQAPLRPLWTTDLDI